MGKQWKVKKEKQGENMVETKQKEQKSKNKRKHKEKQCKNTRNTISL